MDWKGNPSENHEEVASCQMEEIRRIIDKEDNGDDNDVQKFTGAMNSNCPKKSCAWLSKVV